MATVKKSTRKATPAPARKKAVRRADQLRKVEIIRHFIKSPAGAVLIKCGGTHVVCTASIQSGVPVWKTGKGTGWLTAEYDMLPGSTSRRRPRNRFKLDGRTQEIQRLIGRSLRAVVDMAALGENTVQIDCDVLQADGGTRTASITGAYVALHDAFDRAVKDKRIPRSPLTGSVAAVSVGIVKGRTVLDLNYEQDVSADVDFNVVMTDTGRFVEVQGTAEAATFSAADLERMTKLAARGIKQLIEQQNRALRRKSGSR